MTAGRIIDSLCTLNMFEMKSTPEVSVKEKKNSDHTLETLVAIEKVKSDVKSRVIGGHFHQSTLVLL